MVELTKAFDDSQHPVRFRSSLGQDLVVQTMTGQEEIGRLFTFQLQLLSHKTDLHFDSIVGESVTVVVVDEKGGDRYFNGIITEFSYVGSTKKTAHYHAVLKPKLWFLTQTTDCRVFQDKTVPEIIKEVLNRAKMSDFQDNTSEYHRKWEYCVQYRESNFNFISRLMEQEGIIYYFKHEDGNHKMILADNSTLAEAFPGGANVPYSAPSGDGALRTKDHLEYWAATQSIQPNEYVLQDFDFQKPKTDLSVKNRETSSHNQPLGETKIFDYPGEYSVGSDGEEYAKIRLQELRSKHERISASGPCRNLAAGFSFALEDYPREDQNADYLVVSISHQVNAPDYYTGEGSGDLYRCEIDAIHKQVFYRAERLTPNPVIRGPQTAIVVGPGGDEIYTDEYGRVKVQFHWDRYGKKNENSSCYVRVSQLWAGKNWGGIHIPRIGQEVIVSFMEGDPDRPIITGRVYNDDYKPPCDLPADKTKSGIKSRSTPGGTTDTRNEFIFEDKAGEEQVFLRAEKDFVGEVENTRTVEIKGRDDGSPEKTVETLTITGQRETTIEGNDILTLTTGSKGRIVTVKEGSYELKVAMKDYLLNVDKGKSTTEVFKDISTTSQSGNITTKASAGKITIEAAIEILLKVGGTSVKVDNSGVTIDGPMIKLNASGMLDAKGSMTMIDGSSMTKVSGGVVMIN